MSIKKCVNGSFVNDYYREYGTETDTITTLPKSIIADGQSATASIIGNMNQQGTPSPSSIIMPSECGERIGNLANLYGVSKTALNLDFTTTDNMRIVVDGIRTTGANVVPIATPNIVVPAGTYTVKIKMVAGTTANIPENAYGVFFGINGNTYAQRTTPGIKNVGEVGARTFTFSEDTTISSFDIAPGYSVQESNPSVFNNATFECWFYAGSSSDDVPYEPYGYKIPILSGGTTTNVYLGEVQSTRQIKKLVLTGQEGFTLHGSVANLFVLSTITDYLFEEKIITVCTHYRGGVNTGAASAVDGTVRFYWGSSSQSRILYIKDTNYSTATDFKAYLQQQYSAGTPVTVWYVLATPQTTTLNEPLRKIGNYADSVAVSNIPTTGTAESFDIDTELKPSEVDLTYHGWHEHSDTKF